MLFKLKDSTIMLPKIITVENHNHLLLLKQKSLPISLPLSSDTYAIIDAMMEAIKAKGKAAGLAAPQIGINKRIIICSFTGETQDVEIMINPTYINHSNELEEGWEGCFSIPLTFARVARFKTIDVSYSTAHGDIISKQLNGFAARVYQHEHDHLEGILMTEQTSELKTFTTEEEFNNFLQIVRKDRMDSLKNSFTSTAKYIT